MKTNTICQSCGIPLNKDPQNGGSLADGTKSEKYCSYCYQDGEFLYKGTDVKEFQELCRQKMIEGGHHKFSSWLFTRGRSRLERWKKLSL